MKDVMDFFFMLVMGCLVTIMVAATIGIIYGGIRTAKELFKQS